MNGGFLSQAVVYLAAAVLAVPIAKRLGLGSVLGYLLAGIAIGPYALRLVGAEGHDVMHFAEFGVVMMLFLVGLELRPSVLWTMRGPILGLGGGQVVVTTVVVMGIAMAFGVHLRPALVIGMIASSSSTAIVLQSLGEKGLLKTEGGKASFAVLLFQDISVIPMLALMPLLAVGEVSSIDAHGASSRPAWQSAFLILGAVTLIFVAGRYLLQPIFRFLAASRLREVLTAAALLLVLSTAWLMEAVGLSPALGTFLAGVLLAESEYRHQLEADVEPFKGLFLGVFFIAVGASLDFSLVFAEPVKIALATVAIVIVKGVVIFALGRVSKISRPGTFVFAFSLAQVGEFAFVLLSFAQQVGVLEGALPASIVAVVALSMLITPLLFIVLERVVMPRLAPAAEAREADEIEGDEAPVVMAGFGRFGQIAGRILRQNGVPVTVLDVDPEIIDVIRRLGSKVYYGDASRIDLLHAAGCARARLFLIAVDDAEKALEIANTVKTHFPNLEIIARANDRVGYYKLRNAGVKMVIRETFGSALEMGELALHNLGFGAHFAHRAARLFKRHDEASAAKLATIWGSMDQTAFFSEVRQAMDQTEVLMKAEVSRNGAPDEGWDNESLRDDIEAMTKGAAE